MNQTIISGVVIGQDATLSLQELAHVCSVPGEYIGQLVEAGILEPIKPDARQLCFSGNCLHRVQVSIRLQRDLEINLPGIAVILNLLELRETSAAGE